MFILLFILTSHLGGGPCKRGTASATRESSAEASITRATGGLKIQAHESYNRIQWNRIIAS